MAFNEGLKKKIVGDFQLSWLFIGPSPHPQPIHPTPSTGGVPLQTSSTSRPSSLSIHKTPGRTAWRREVAHVSVGTSAARYMRALSLRAGSIQTDSGDSP